LGSIARSSYREFNQSLVSFLFPSHLSHLKDQSANLVIANLEASEAAKAAKKAEIYGQFLAQVEAAMNSTNEAIDGLPLDYLTEEDRGMFRAVLKGQIQAVQVNAASALTL
jgi:regulator of sigma D